MFASQAMLYEVVEGRLILHGMPIMLVVLCVLALAYRYYSAFLAARVAVLNDARLTPAHQFNDGQNYHPTNRWVLFGHHFAAISGAGPLIGPVLAVQYGYMPGLLWLLIGVVLAGATQDMLVLAASVRRGGKSLAEIARAELGPFAYQVVSAAILFIVIIALAGLGIVVVKALGGEERPTAQIRVRLPQGAVLDHSQVPLYRFPAGCEIVDAQGNKLSDRPLGFEVRIAGDETIAAPGADRIVQIPEKSTLLIPGSSWGTFTIAATIPIALFIGLYMYRIRKGAVVEASVIGAVLTLAAVVAGNWIPDSPLEPFFSLGRLQTTFALAAYGFVASVLPVWLLLCPRDYLSSFLKIGTIGLLVGGVLVANPALPCPMFNETFASRGPTFPWGGVFPFVFVCIMCGAVSGFHSLVSSGTTPKMIDKETDIRAVGYGAMLIEGLVGVVALLAASSLDPKIYYEMNIDASKVAIWQPKVDRLIEEMGPGGLTHLPVERRDLNKVEELVGGETLSGRTGGAATLAVGMSFILTDAFKGIGISVETLMKYWYHFAIMFEALFILTTIDTGTRIARFLLQEALGNLYAPFARTEWLPGSILTTLLVTASWGLLIATGSIDTVWPMFGVANQLLAVVALCVVTTWLVNTGRSRYAWVTLVPMLFVGTTTLTAAALMIPQFLGLANEWGEWKTGLNVSLMMFVILCVLALVLYAVTRWLAVWWGVASVRSDDVAT
ncbi:MAG: carbon starvation protein A [Gemmataceae bacterium]